MRIYYAEAVYGEEEIHAVMEVLRHSAKMLMGGAKVREFERSVADIFGKKIGIMVNSGSSANTLALACLGLKPGDEIITPALTFSTTVAPIVQQSCVPCFVDAEPNTFTLRIDQVESMITDQTRAILVPNLIGNLPDWRELRKIADRHNLILIEDSADTLGSKIDGRNTGPLSDIATTSFYGSHIITCAGFGGMACFNDEELAHRAMLMRGWGRRSSLSGESEDIDNRFNCRVDGVEYDSKFIFDLPGYNFMPSEAAAAFGLEQLKRLENYIERRIANWNRLRAFFSNYGDIFILPRQIEDVRTPWLAFPLIVRDTAPFSRNEMQIHFEKHGIQTRPVFTGNILRQPGFQGIARREHPDGFPNADRVMRGGMLLGCHQALGEAELDYICETFKALIATS